MTFIKSSDIKVYPASSRGIGDILSPYNNNPESKLFTENNIVGLVNRLAKVRNNTNNESASIEVNHSFVISDSFNENKSFEICINGYYFVIKSMTSYMSSFSNNSDIYAKIIVKNKNSNYIVNELVGYNTTQGSVVDDLDTNSETGDFIALILENNPDIPTYTDCYTDCSCYCLHILTKVNNTWTIPSTSKIIISADYVGLSDYNGKLHNLYEYFERDKDGNLIIKQANKLQYSKTLWGNEFNGTQKVEGTLDNVKDIHVIAASTYDIGENNKHFKNAYVDNIYTTEVEASTKVSTDAISAISVSANTINPSTCDNSCVGTSDFHYKQAYIDTINSTSVSSTNLTATNITCCESSNSSIGTSSKPYTNVYATNFIGNEFKGIAESAKKLGTPRTVTVNGDASGSFSYDGDKDSTLNLDVTKSPALDSTNVGNVNTPVYFNEEGKPVAINYTIEASVPTNAKFTDTTYNCATTSIAGLMSISDKSKLDGISIGANKVTFSLNSSGILTITTS